MKKSEIIIFRFNITASLIVLFSLFINTNLIARNAGENSLAIDTNTLLSREEVKRQFAFAFKFNMSLSAITLNELARQYFDTKFALDNAFGIAIHKWNFAIGWSYYSKDSKKDIFTQNQLVVANSTFGFTRNYLNLGYSLDIAPSFSIEPKIGVTRMKFFPPTNMEIEQFFRRERTTGLDLGLTLNIYKLLNNEMTKGKGFPYIAWFLGVEQNFINYKSFYPEFGSNSFIVSFGIALKPYIHVLNQRN